MDFTNEWLLPSLFPNIVMEGVDDKKEEKSHNFLVPFTPAKRAERPLALYSIKGSICIFTAWKLDDRTAERQRIWGQQKSGKENGKRQYYVTKFSSNDELDF